MYWSNLFFIKNEIKYKTTGSLIGENLVLTLASNIYDFEYKNFFFINIIFKDSNDKLYKNPIKKCNKNF